MPDASPILYHPALETIELDEAAIARELVAEMHGIQETTFRDYGHALRSVHAKSHGLLQGELRVLNELPATLAQGLFAQPGAYPVIMRLSTTPGDILDDRISTPRGLALKVIGVAGEQLSGHADTQNFVLADAPAFAAANPKAFLGNLRLLAKTTDAAPGLKKAASAVLRGAEAVVESFGGKSAALISLGGHKLSNPLGETFYTQAPLRYGHHVAKLRVSPASPNLAALKDAAVEMAGRPNALRETVTAFFAEQGAEWEVAVQLCTDTAAMPIEDASVAWPETLSPYRPVARIIVPPQPAWTETRAALVDDQLTFSPWRGLVAHRPLGSIMRARKPAYEMSAEFRARHNGCPIHEPHAPLGSLPA
jgi:hypothetical protein